LIASFWINGIPQLEAALGYSLNGTPFDTIDNMIDDIYCDFFDGRAPNITNELMEQLLQMDYQYRALWRYAQPIAKLAFTGFVREITGYFDQVLVDDATSESDTYRLKFVFYSGHDTNIAIAATALQIPMYTMPHFGSTMFFELHSNESSSSSNPRNNYYVRLIYNDEDIDFTNQCDSQHCTLLQFEQLAQNAVFQGDLLKECHTPVSVPKFRTEKAKTLLKEARSLFSANGEKIDEKMEAPVDSTLGILVIVSTLILTFILFVAVFVVFILRRRKRGIVGGQMVERFDQNTEIEKEYKREGLPLLQVEI